MRYLEVLKEGAPARLRPRSFSLRPSPPSSGVGGAGEQAGARVRSAPPAGGGGCSRRRGSARGGREEEARWSGGRTGGHPRRSCSGDCSRGSPFSSPAAVADFPPRLVPSPPPAPAWGGAAEGYRGRLRKLVALGWRGDPLAAAPPRGECSVPCRAVPPPNFQDWGGEGYYPGQEGEMDSPILGKGRCQGAGVPSPGWRSWPSAPSSPGEAAHPSPPHLPVAGTRRDPVAFWSWERSLCIFAKRGRGGWMAGPGTLLAAC